MLNVRPITIAAKWAVTEVMVVDSSDVTEIPQWLTNGHGQRGCRRTRYDERGENRSQNYAYV